MALSTRLNRRLFPVVATALLAALAWWQFGERRPPAPELDVEEAERRADYYLRGFELLSSGEDGRWRYRLQGERMLHFPDDGSWTLQAPALSLLTESGAPWRGEAPRGQVWNDGREARLHGAVTLRRAESAANRPVTIQTREVYLRPQEHYAETAEPVTVTQDASRLEAVGARVYADQERYELLSEVEARYAPE